MSPGVDPIETQAALDALRNAMNAYHPLADSTWRALAAACKYRLLARGEVLYGAGVIPSTFAFVFQGLLRSYITDDKGNEYNKVFFAENRFPGSMVALLTSSPSRFTVDALEQSFVVEIEFKTFRHLLQEHHDLALYQIQYLEHNWLLSKEPREVSLVQEDAGQRYQRFLTENPGLSERIPQYHIASHLGITPTQLSRIRRQRAQQNPQSDT